MEKRSKVKFKVNVKLFVVKVVLVFKLVFKCKVVEMYFVVIVVVKLFSFSSVL